MTKDKGVERNEKGKYRRHELERGKKSDEMRTMWGDEPREH